MQRTSFRERAIPEMWLSTRKRFRRGDPSWDRYIEFIGLPSLAEVRTIDWLLNEIVDECEIECSAATLSDALTQIPSPASDEYVLLCVDANDASRLGGEWTLLGHDLADDTGTSSLLNCGPWSGRLAPFVERLNAVGLLGSGDAKDARDVLAQEWGLDEPHAHVTIWALYSR